ncbi:MAG TPA: GerMN domain-containing protein [Micromonosporaceae bacterium]|nr:GerMN domain-containing protein [Micromonosporaceae bacterium]
MNEHDLRRVLDAEAASVEVSPDALVAIRQRIAARRARWLPRGGAMFAVSTGGLAALATAVAVFAGVGSCAPRTDEPPPPAASAPVETPSPTPSPAQPAPPGPTAAPPSTTRPPQQASASVPVYYIGLDRGRPRLYREFHQLPVGDGSPAARTRAAVTEMLDRDSAYDPDYASSWPAGARVRGVRIAGDAVVVDLTGAGQNSVGSEYAHQAVQQLVWTATAASGKPKVRILLDGAPVSELWGSVSVAGDLVRGPALQVLALIWLIGPQHGATVGRTFEVHVDGAVFEATVQLRVVQNGRTVTERVMTLSVGAPSRGEGRVSLTLAPGAYTIEAFAYSAEDGSIQHLDNHQITVR